jgi:hypothetical protein
MEELYPQLPFRLPQQLACRRLRYAEGKRGGAYRSAGEYRVDELKLTKVDHENITCRY